MNSQSNIITINDQVATVKTVEQLKADLAAAQELVAQAEREARQQLEAAQRAERNAKHEAAEEVIKAAMATAFAPVKAHFKTYGGVLEEKRFQLVLAHNVTVDISRETSGNASPYYVRTSYTGRYVVTVEYGNQYGAEKCASRYPSKKDGTFSLDKMRDKAYGLIDAAQSAVTAAKVKAAQQQSSAELAEKLNEELGTKLCKATYGRLSQVTHTRQEWREFVAPEGKVYIGANLYNPAQVRVYVEMMAEITALATK